MLTANPLKLFHLAFELTALVAYYIPRWLVAGIRVWLYEDKKGNWTFGRHMRVRALQHMMSLGHRGVIPRPRIPDHTAVQGRGGIWISAAPDDLIVGEISTLAHDHNVSSISIPGYWIHKDTSLPYGSPPSPGEKIFYHFHGGGYVSQTAHPDGWTSRVLKDFLRNSSSPLLRRTFAVEYRLIRAGEPGKAPSGAFPSALIDALAGYLYLVRLGFREEDIIVVGDSAGGNMALALTRYLLLNGEKHPKLPKIPGSLVLLSPFTDASDQFVDHFDSRSSPTVNAERDWLGSVNGPVRRKSARVFLGGRPDCIELAYSNHYISPASPVLLGLTPEFPTRTISFKGFPRTFIDNGTFDLLYDQILRLATAMKEDLGEDMVYNETEGAPHDYLILDGFDPDRTETSKKILKWSGL